MWSSSDSDSDARAQGTQRPVRSTGSTQAAPSSARFATSTQDAAALLLREYEAKLRALHVEYQQKLRGLVADAGRSGRTQRSASPAARGGTAPIQGRHVAPPPAAPPAPAATRPTPLIAVAKVRALLSDSDSDSDVLPAAARRRDAGRHSRRVDAGSGRAGARGTEVDPRARGTQRLGGGGGGRDARGATVPRGEGPPLTPPRGAPEREIARQEARFLPREAREGFDVPASGREPATRLRRLRAMLDDESSDDSDSDRRPAERRTGGGAASASRLAGSRLSPTRPRLTPSLKRQYDAHREVLRSSPSRPRTAGRRAAETPRSPDPAAATKFAGSRSVVLDGSKTLRVSHLR